MKKLLIGIVIVVLVGLGIYLVANNYSNNPAGEENAEQSAGLPPDEASSTNNLANNNTAEVVIGKSVGGKNITAYNFGTGDTNILFVGGIHGGYSWNTPLVAYELMDYLKANPAAIPANVKVTVIPVLNPDGLAKVVGTSGNFSASDVSKDNAVVVSGRFNGDNVDINRNFDCDWRATGTWQSKTVSGGSAAFSEPEAQAIKNYVDTAKPAAVVAWFSSAGGVYASSCHNGVSTATDALTKAFASASGYKAYETFDYYSLTGDMMNWLAKINVPAISVLLTNHTDTEWTKNKAGVDAVLKYFAK